MPEISKTHLGGTMRLGLRPTIFDEDSASWSKIRKMYGGNEVIWERHRHRYEVGPPYVDRLVKSGLHFIGKDEKGERMQVLELKGALIFGTLRPLTISLNLALYDWRSSVFRRVTSSSGVLHATHQPLSTFPRFNCSGLKS